MFSIEHIHPMVVHFPIAFILTGFLAELVYLFFRKEHLLSVAGFWLLLVGTLGAVASYASGAFFTQDLQGAGVSIQNTHELFAEITTISALIAALFKIYLKMESKEDTALKWISFAVYAFTTISVCITGYYGGVMVYGYLLKSGV